MFKNIISTFLLVFMLAFAGQSFGVTEPALPANDKSESDSTNVKSKQLVTSDRENPTTISTTNDRNLAFWQQDEEVEEDSTSNSALSFNFIYYVIEKFKFQVE